MAATRRSAAQRLPWVQRIRLSHAARAYVIRVDLHREQRTRTPSPVRATSRHEPLPPTPPLAELFTHVPKVLISMMLALVRPATFAPIAPGLHRLPPNTRQSAIRE